MPVDASIYSQVGRKSVQPLNPLDAMANAYQLQNAQIDSQNKQQAMRDDQMSRQAAMQAGGDSSKLYQLLMQGGNIGAAQNVQKSTLDYDQGRANISKDEATAKKTLSDVEAAKIKMHADMLSQVQDPEQAMQWAELGKSSGALQQGQYQMAIQNIQRASQSPQSFEAWKNQAALGARDYITQNAPKFNTVNAGNAQVTTAREGLTGRVIPTLGQSTPILQSADSIASQQTQMRGQNMVDARARDGLNLRAKELDAAGQSSGGGSVLGVPAPAVLPWNNQSNPRDANKVKASEQTRGAKEIEKDLDAAKKEREAAAAAKRFLELNKGTNTGGLLDRVGVTRWAQGMGDNYSEMESITAKLAPAMREPGSGSTSDFDGKQFERATVGVDKPGNTNQNIAKGVIARAQQAEDYADFRQTYLEQNGTLQGADRFWKDYANKNPIFDLAKEGTFELNAARKPWRDHFKAAKPAAPASPAAGALSASEAAELAELRRRLGK